MFQEHAIVWDDAKVARLWNWYSRTSPFRDLYFAKRFGDRILRASGVPFSQPLTVLDFGCGPGFLWDHIRTMGTGWTYYGADFSPDSTAQLAQRAAGQTGFGSAEHLRALPMRCEDGRYDAAFLVEVVEHVDDNYLAPILREMARVLKPGGQLVISTPNREDLSQSMRLCPECGAIFHEWQHVRAWHADSLTDYVARFGFRPRQVAPIDFFARGPHRAALNALRRLVHGTAKPHLLGVYEHVA
jgi:SAM-dependent methyltransferase